MKKRTQAIKASKPNWKNKRAAKSPAAELHLWKVRLDGTTSYLWITTKANDLIAALTKARKLLKNTEFEYFGHVVTGAKYRGTIDG